MAGLNAKAVGVAAMEGDSGIARLRRIIKSGYAANGDGPSGDAMVAAFDDDHEVGQGHLLVSDRRGKDAVELFHPTVEPVPRAGRLGGWWVRIWNG